MANGRTGRSAAKNSLFTSSEEIAERKRKERASFGSKVDEANAKRKAEREAKAAKRKEQMEESTARLSERKKAAKIKSQPNRNPRGKGSSKAEEGVRGRSGSAANTQGSTAFAAAMAKKKKEKKESTKAQPKFGVGKEFTIRGNKANVTADQLNKTGLTQAQYMKQWRASNKRPTAASVSKAKTKPTTTTKTPRKVGGIRKFLLGKDGKFGGARGAIDFLPGKSRIKKEDKPVKKMGGGMMKSKMASKGGARGGRKAMGMKNGGFPDLTGDGKVTQADILQGRGVTKKAKGGMMKSKGMSKGGAMKTKGMAKGGAMKAKGMAKGGAMKKKGYAKGGMTKKGYAKGGAVRSKMASKGGKRGGASSKPRGVGVAKRGFGKAMR